MKLKTENRKVKQLKEKLFIVGILGIVAVVVGIGMSIFSSFNKTSIDPKMQELIKPFNPTLDIEYLQSYQSTRVVPPETFKIISVTNGETKTQKIIDPFQTGDTVETTATQSSNPL